MFFAGSRYERTGTYHVIGPGGREVTVAKPHRPPPRERVALLGFHPRTEDQRLDVIAAHYLGDATAFWRLCDANATAIPDALAARDRIGIPAGRS
jgi:hypothetical protein